MQSERKFLTALLKALQEGRPDVAAKAIDARLRNCGDDGCVSTQGGGLPPKPPTTPPDP